MKKYNIVDETGHFWSHNGRFGYWSKFSNDSDKKRRRKYFKLIGKIILWLMKKEKVKAKLVVVGR